MRIFIFNRPGDVRTFLRITLMLVLAASIGCQKEKAAGPGNQEDPGSIKYVLNDNFNFSVITVALQATNLQDTLAKKGPYTFLAPDNPAFALVAITDPAFAYSFSYIRATLPDMMHYYILPGRNSFKNLPIGENNKPFATLTGGNVYVSTYLDGTDTIITVNGQKLRAADNTASNGFIQVLPQLLNPELYPTMTGRIHNDTTLTFFAAAVQRANLDLSLLGGSEAYTVLAPSNNAFRQSGNLGLSVDLSSMDAILHSDPVQLAALLQYHILKGRFFQGDLYRAALADPSGVTMLNGENLIIGGNAAGFHAITFQGKGNLQPSHIYLPPGYNVYINNADFPCGNGVIHIIDQILVP